MIRKYFLPFCGFFHCLDSVLWHMKLLKFDELPIILSLAACSLDVIPKKPLCTLKAKTFPSMFPFLFSGPHHAACGIPTPQPGTGPGTSAVKAQSPSHETAREFLCFLLKVLQCPWLHLGLWSIWIHICTQLVRESTSFSCGGPSTICWQACSDPSKWPGTLLENSCLRMYGFTSGLPNLFH